MINIRKANRTDLPGIVELMAEYGLMKIDASYINRKDVSLVAYNDEGETVGFIFVGMMCNNNHAYCDKLVVSSEYNKKGVGKALCEQAFIEAIRRGAQTCTAVVRQDEYFPAVAMNGLKIAAKGDRLPYMLLTITRENTLKECFKDLRTTHGR